MHTSVFHTSTTCFHIEFTRHWRTRLLDDTGIAPEPQELLSGRVPVLAGQLYQEFRRSDVCSPLVLEGLACELIGWTARGLKHEARRPSWVYQARDLLHDRFNETLRLTDVAEVTDVHPVHLAREFKREFGLTVGEYARQLRVEYVGRQLSTNVTLADLALQAGFSDQSHLTRVFALTTAAAALGPHLSGLLTPFPVAATILAGSTHYFEGSAAVTLHVDNTNELLEAAFAGVRSSCASYPATIQTQPFVQDTECPGRYDRLLGSQNPSSRDSSPARAESVTAADKAVDGHSVRG
jgi:AraC-like DNA-binding protein